MHSPGFSGSTTMPEAMAKRRLTTGRGLQRGVVDENALPQGPGHLFADVQTPRLPVLEAVPFEKRDGDERPPHKLEVPSFQRSLAEDVPETVVGPGKMRGAVDLPNVCEVIRG